MIIQVTKNIFMDAFRTSSRKDSFSYNGLIALFEYLDCYCDDNTIELDIIGIDSEFTEYEDLAEYNKDNNGEYETLEELESETTVIQIGSESFIVSNI